VLRDPGVEVPQIDSDVLSEANRDELSPARQLVHVLRRHSEPRGGSRDGQQLIVRRHVHWNTRHHEPRPERRLRFLELADHDRDLIDWYGGRVADRSGEVGTVGHHPVRLAL
jgi:hypothetical protein